MAIEEKKARSLKQLKEAYPNIGQEEEDWGWRSLTQEAKRDLSPTTQKRMQDIASHLYDSNPMAHRIPEIMKDFVVGDGFSFTAPNPRVLKILNDFWHDKDTNWEDEQDRSVLELSLFGEQCYPVFVNKINGHVKMSYIDPGQIYSVKLDRNNPKFVKSIVWQPTLSADKRTIDVIHPERSRRKKNYGKMVGKDKDKLEKRQPDGCFYFRINNVTLASRGRSDLLCVSDWIDGYDQFLFARLERAFLLNNFVWDILCKGMSKEEIEEFSKDFKAPRPGSMRFHNENVEWHAVAPTLLASDASQEASLFKTQILGGKGFPSHWFAEGEKTTRATAQEMGLPTLKMLKSRQRYHKFMFKSIFQFVIDQAVIHGELNEKEDLSFHIVVSPLAEKDTRGAALTLDKFTNSLVTATEKDWVTNEAAAKAYRTFVLQLGIEMVDDQEEKEEYKKAKEGAKKMKHKDCKNFDSKAKTCILKGISVNPEGDACPEFEAKR